MRLLFLREALGSNTSCPIYPKIKLRTVSQHHTEQPRQWIASRHVTANKGEVIIITTNWMVEVSRTLLLAHIYNFFSENQLSNHGHSHTFHKHQE